MADVMRRTRPARPVLDWCYRLAALLAWAGQLVVLGAPLVEARAGAGAPVHVESHGNPLHHAHNPDLCPACAALALIGRPEVPRSPVPPALSAERRPSARTMGEHDAGARRFTRSRAPPV